MHNWNAFSSFCFKKQTNCVTPIIDSSLMCEEGRSCLNVDQTPLYCMTCEAKKKYISTSFNRWQEEGSSHYCSLWWVWAPTPWQWAVIAQMIWDKTSPLIRNHHISFNQLNCPSHVTLFTVCTPCTHEDYLFRKNQSSASLKTTCWIQNRVGCFKTRQNSKEVLDCQKYIYIGMKNCQT